MLRERGPLRYRTHGGSGILSWGVAAPKIPWVLTKINRSTPGLQNQSPEAVRPSVVILNNCLVTLRQKRPWTGNQIWIDLASNLGSFTVGYVTRQWHPTPVPLLGKSHGRRSLLGCNPWGR